MKRSFEKFLAKKASGLALSLVLLTILACSPLFPAPAATPTSYPVPGVDELGFKDPETGRRFRSLNDYIDQYVDATWQITSYQLIGNFYESKWCRGAGVRPDCQTIYSTTDNRDQHILELYTLFYAYDFSRVFGLGFHSYWVPMATGWGTSFYFAEGGEGVVSEGWQVTFSEYATPTGPPGATITLGNDYSYSIFETSINYSPGLPIREDLALYLAGPEAMRDRGLDQVQALADMVKEQVSAHQVPACDPNPYQGGGVNPGCTSRPMTPAEETAELARAAAYFADQEGLLRDQYQEMFTAWMSAFPLDQQWP